MYQKCCSQYYAPETGLYISQDPIGLAGNNPNFYAYVFDSNIQVDVFGLFEFVTKEGFLFGSFKIKAPFNIPVQRFGNIPEGQVRPWGLRVGTSEFINRVFVAIKSEWNPLTVYNTGIIPKGTEIRIGIIGLQGLKYLGGLLQFNVNNSDVKNIKTRKIDRNKVKCKT